MSFSDKAKIAAQKAGGKAKEVVGDVTDNKSLKNKGKREQASAHLKKIGQDIKDTFK